MPCVVCVNRYTYGGLTAIFTGWYSLGIPDTKRKVSMNRCGGFPMKGFFDRLRETCEKKDSLLCVGLDPRIVSGKPHVRRGRAIVTETMDEDYITEVVDTNRRIIEATLPYTACYKPNIAFYEAAGPAGLVALERTLSLIPEDTPVILDAKRSDIGATAEAYAEAIFGHFGADAVTLNPYMGRDAVDPFLEYRDRGIFMLCRTSNPAAGEVQELHVSGEAFYLKVAEACVSWGEAIGLVVAGNEAEVLREIRERFPSVWLLAPGIGTQGGDAGEAVAAGRDADGLGISAGSGPRDSRSCRSRTSRTGIPR